MNVSSNVINTYCTPLAKTATITTVSISLHHRHHLLLTYKPVHPFYYPPRSLIRPTTGEEYHIIPTIYPLPADIIVRIGWTHHWTVSILVRIVWVALIEELVWLWTLWATLILILLVHNVLVLDLLCIVVVWLTLIFILVTLSFILRASTKTASIYTCCLISVLSFLKYWLVLL